MAINFPDSPSVGATHSDGGAVWKWNGYAWRRVPDPGAKGEPGQKGEKGQKGEVGLTGAQGDKGVKGEPSTVAGAKGQKGEDGQKGSTGAGGDKGAKGEPSTVAGDKGDKGDKGGTGAGTKGEKGAGSSVTIGVSPPTSPTPAPGDMWWDSDDADLHVYYNDGNSAQWVSVTSSAALKGQTGNKGDKGQKGELNDKGQKGDTGAVAAKGQKGEIGATGGSGGTGSPGDKGQKGAPGSAGSTGIPSGFIGLWSGAANAIPSGWYLCDGNNGTPNLKNRFVVGAGDSYNVGVTGGFDSVSLFESQIPSHSHGVSLTTGSDSHTHSYNSANHPTSGGPEQNQSGGPEDRTTFNVGKTTGSDSHSHSVSGNTGGTGGGGAHENRPPYYALCYIMKS